MASSNNPPRGCDEVITHVITELFANNKDLKSTLKANNINSRKALYDAVKDTEVMKRVRWKNGNEADKEMIPKSIVDELMLVPSYINWTQNRYGTLPNCAIDVKEETSREMFDIFLCLDDHGRGGQHGDGTVSYDETAAFASERRYKRGVFTSTGTSSAASVASIVPTLAPAPAPSNPAPPAQSNIGNNNNNAPAPAPPAPAPAPPAPAPAPPLLVPAPASANNPTASNLTMVNNPSQSSAPSTSAVNNPSATTSVVNPPASGTSGNTTSALLVPGNLPGNGLANPVNCRAAAVAALTSFNKKIKAGEETWSKLESASDWPNWFVKHLGKLVLTDSDDMVRQGSKPPDPSTSSPEEVTLYKKKNTHLYIALMDSIQTTEGMTIVKGFQDTMDGVGAWKALQTHYSDDMAAITRTKYLFGLICKSQIPLNHRGLARAIEQFKGWILEHNHYCKKGEEILGNTMLMHFERYIESIEKLRDLKTQIDIHDDTVLRAAGSTATSSHLRSPSAKIDFYYRQAQQMDATFKTTVLNTRRKVNHTMLDWDIDPYASYDVNVGILESPSDQLIAAVEQAYLVNAGETRKKGYLPADSFGQLNRDGKRAWLTLPADTREMIMNALQNEMKPPPSNTEEHRLPGVGIAGRNARANLSDATPGPPEAQVEERQMNFTAIEAMRARATPNHDNRNLASPPDASVNASQSARRDITTIPPFEPGRLMSTDNRSTTELVPINPSTRNVSMARSSIANSVNVRETLYNAAFPDIFGALSASSRSVSMAISSRVSSYSVLSPSFGESVLMSRGLIDGGANTGLANPEELRLLHYAYPPRYINVNTAGDMNIEALQIGTFAGKVTLETGESFVLIFNEYGELLRGPSVHSKIQLVDGGCNVCDIPAALSGEQCITVQEQVIPLVFNQGLPFVELTYPSEEDLENLPKINMTCPEEWNPSKYDDTIPSDDETKNESSSSEVSNENVREVDTRPASRMSNPFDDHSSIGNDVPSRGQSRNESFFRDLSNPIQQGRFYYCDDLMEVTRYHNGTVIAQEAPDPTRNMSERWIEAIRGELQDLGAYMGIAMSPTGSTNPFDNPADIFTHRRRQSFDLDQALIRSSYMNPQESMHYVD